MRQQLLQVTTRVRYAALGAAVGAGVGALFGRNSASTGGAVGGFVGAIYGEKRVTARTAVERLRESNSERVDAVRAETN